MTEQHECVWTPIDTNFGEIEEAEWFVCEHCPAILSREEVIARLNEYETLKTENELWHDAVSYCSVTDTVHFDHDKIANLMEGK